MSTSLSAGDLLRQARRKARLSQIELGLRARVAQSVISAYESGHREPSFPMLLRLIEATGLSLDVTLRDDRKRFDGPIGKRVEVKRKEILDCLARHGFSNPRVFGSVARGEDRYDSDLDLLVNYPNNLSLVSLSRAESELEKILGAPVELVSEKDLKDSVRNTISNELVEL